MAAYQSVRFFWFCPLWGTVGKRMLVHSGSAREITRSLAARPLPT